MSEGMQSMLQYIVESGRKLAQSHIKLVWDFSVQKASTEQVVGYLVDQVRKLTTHTTRLQAFSNMTETVSNAIIQNETAIFSSLKKLEQEAAFAQNDVKNLNSKFENLNFIVNTQNSEIAQLTQKVTELTRYLENVPQGLKKLVTEDIASSNSEILQKSRELNERVDSLPLLLQNYVDENIATTTKNLTEMESRFQKQTLEQKNLCIDMFNQTMTKMEKLVEETKKVPGTNQEPIRQMKRELDEIQTSHTHLLNMAYNQLPPSPTANKVSPLQIAPKLTQIPSQGSTPDPLVVQMPQQLISTLPPRKKIDPTVETEEQKEFGTTGLNEFEQKFIRKCREKIELAKTDQEPEANWPTGMFTPKQVKLYILFAAKRMGAHSFVKKALAKEKNDGRNRGANPNPVPYQQLPKFLPSKRKQAGETKTGTGNQPTRKGGNDNRDKPQQQVRRPPQEDRPRSGPNKKVQRERNWKPNKEPQYNHLPEGKQPRRGKGKPSGNLNRRSYPITSTNMAPNMGGTPWQFPPFGNMLPYWPQGFPLPPFTHPTRYGQWPQINPIY
jgi:hypothetical protein